MNAIESARSNAQRILANADAFEKMVEERGPRPDDGYVSIGVLRVDVDIPWNVNTLRKWRKWLGEGFELQQVGSWGEPSHYRSYEKDGVRIDINLCVGLSGSTCRKVKTGQKLIDVYEVVCD